MSGAPGRDGDHLEEAGSDLGRRMSLVDRILLTPKQLRAKAKQK